MPADRNHMETKDSPRDKNGRGPVTSLKARAHSPWTSSEKRKRGAQERNNSYRTPVNDIFVSDTVRCKEGESFLYPVRAFLLKKLPRSRAANQITACNRSTPAKMKSRPASLFPIVPGSPKLSHASSCDPLLSCADSFVPCMERCQEGTGRRKEGVFSLFLLSVSFHSSRPPLSARCSQSDCVLSLFVIHGKREENAGEISLYVTRDLSPPLSRSFFRFFLQVFSALARNNHGSDGLGGDEPGDDCVKSLLTESYRTRRKRASYFLRSLQYTYV